MNSLLAACAPVARPPLLVAAAIALASAASGVQAAEVSAFPAASLAKPIFAASARIADRDLAASRAGSATAVVDVSGSLQQTSAVNVHSGANTIADGSFTNALGLTTVIQNSGSNVLIQNATTVNVQFK